MAGPMDRLHESSEAVCKFRAYREAPRCRRPRRATERVAIFSGRQNGARPPRWLRRFVGGLVDGLIDVCRTGIGEGREFYGWLLRCGLPRANQDDENETQKAGGRWRFMRCNHEYCEEQQSCRSHR